LLARDSTPAVAGPANFLEQAMLTATEQAATTMIQRAMVSPAPHTLRFTYRAASGEITDREAEPYELKNGILFAWCLEKNAIRQFKLDGMTNVVIGKPFNCRPDSKGNLMPIKIPC